MGTTRCPVVGSRGGLLAGATAWLKQRWVAIFDAELEESAGPALRLPTSVGRRGRRAERALATGRFLRILLPGGLALFGLASALLLLSAKELQGERAVIKHRNAEVRSFQAELLAIALTEKDADRSLAMSQFSKGLDAWMDQNSSWLRDREGHEPIEPKEAERRCSGYLSDAARLVMEDRRRVDAGLSDRWDWLYFVVIAALSLCVVAIVLFGRNSRARVRIADLYLRATRDPMTGGLNRAAVLEDGARNLARCQREDKPMAVMIVDLDHFKRVNDGYGHAAGDRVIQLAAERISDNLRAYDSVGRYGGDEFLVVLPHTDLVETRGIAERLSKAFAQPVQQPGLPPKLSASIGAAVATGPNQTLEEVIEAADRALYRRKAKGRNGWIVQETKGRSAAAGSKPLCVESLALES